MAALLLAASFFLLGLDSGASTNPAPQIYHPPVVETPYADGRLTADLATLHALLGRNSRAEMEISHKGPGWRVYEHFASVFAPEDCVNLARVKIWSERTSAGFKAKGVCEKGEGPEIEVRWRGVKADIYASAQGGAITKDFRGPRH